MKRIIIIGGGIAGISAAIKAKCENNEVIVLEKNKTCLKKLLITGNGHCNYYNDKFDVSCYDSTDKQLLDNIINEDSKSRLEAFYKEIGLVPRVKNGYYYPYSNQAYAVLNALMKEAFVKGVKIVNEVEVLDIKKANNFIIETSGEKYTADVVIIATGSKSYPKTGSTGDGYKFAKMFNHTVNKVYPALVQVLIDDKYIKELDGIRNDAKVTLLIDNKPVKEEFGEVQFTKNGLSGICIYNLTLSLNKYLDEGREVNIAINFLSGLGINTKSDLDNHLISQNSILKNRTLVELLEEVINYNVVNTIFKKLKIDQNIKYDNLEVSVKDKLLNELINYEVSITGTKDYDSAQVCSGGISLNELDINTFESKLVKDLYFVGEMVDVTGICGGYNISFAVLSGLKAGDNCD